MLVIELEYLTGRAVATDREVRNRPEWPPHPQRLFSALVAAYHECDLGDGVREALMWLESLKPPLLAVSPESVRESRPVYVPVNDAKAPDEIPRKGFTMKQLASGITVLPESRNRQERFFPAVIPHDPVVQFQWPDADAADVDRHRSALARLFAEVPYLGHSSSLVRVSLAEEPRAATWRPAREDETSKADLRVLTTNRLALLETLHGQSVERQRRREPPDTPRRGYVPVQDEEQSTGTVFGADSDWFIFERKGGRPLPLSACLALTTSVRKALCSKCADPLPEILCGHRDDGSPLERPHVAFIPLSFVNHRHADGDIKGFAVVLPKNVSDRDRKRILQALGAVRKIWENGDKDCPLVFDWRVEPVTGTHRMRTLQPSTYLAPRGARFWATVTPMVFGHFPRTLGDARTARIVRDSCQAIGLPAPKAVYASTVSKLAAVPPSTDFPSLSTNGKPLWTSFVNGRHVLQKHPGAAQMRVRAHIAMEFEAPVHGPVILGAGRYFGMGLCLPLPERFPG